MPDITIPEAAVEAAARNMFYLRATEPDESVPCRDTDWDSLPDSWQEEWRDGARAALTAAAPHIAAQALRDAAEAFYGPDGPRGEVGPAVWLKRQADRIEADHG